MNTSKLIAQALLGNDEDKETALRQITCNAASSTAMVCECGSIHDERRIHVIEVIHNDGKEQTLAACCPQCFAKNLTAIENVAKKATAEYLKEGQTPPRVRVATWKKFIFIDAK